MFKLFQWLRQNIASAIAGGILDGVSIGARALSGGEVSLDSEGQVPPANSLSPPAIEPAPRISPSRNGGRRLAAQTKT